MSRILILKTGETLPALSATLGDFEDWIVTVADRPAEDFRTVSVHLGESLPAHADVTGIIVTGSPAMVTDTDAWIRDSEAFLRLAVELNVPVLGVCFGHQLLAQALGGHVDYHPHGREIGTTELTLHASAADDALFNVLPGSFPVHATHMQSVMRVPEHAVILAGNAFDPHHGVRFADRAWGVQFHPEFDATIMAGYLTERAEQVNAEGLDAQALLAQVKETPEAAALLRRFASLCNQESHWPV